MPMLVGWEGGTVVSLGVLLFCEHQKFVIVFFGRSVLGAMGGDDVDADKARA